MQGGAGSAATRIFPLRIRAQGSAPDDIPQAIGALMTMKHPKSALWRAALLACIAATVLPASSYAAGDVDEARLKAADSEPQNWFTLGRDGNQTYFSPLSTIDAANVDRLGFAWSYDMSTARGQEATPIVVDGVMYTSGTWGYVYAVDAATGKQLWFFDPQADPRAARNPCCDLVNRGVAVRQGKVFVASVDGYSRLTAYE